MRVWANHHLLHCANKKKYPTALRELENNIPTDLRELKDNSNFLACAMIRHAYGVLMTQSVARPDPGNFDRIWCTELRMPCMSAQVVLELEARLPDV